MFNSGSEIAYNDISHSNLIADDCGLLYTVGGPYNMTIHHNWLHDTYSRGSLYKAAGIYLDNDAEAFLVHHDVVWNTEWSSIQINLDGTNIDVFNNTLWDASAAMGAWHREGTQFTDVRVWNNLADNGAWEPQSDKQNNFTTYGDPFQDFAGRNFVPKAGSGPIDYGRPIEGITGTHYGLAPDAGAYEYGAPSWKAGIDWDPALGPDVCASPGVYLEKDGFVVVEGESAPEPGAAWRISEGTGDGSLGYGFLEYTGPDQMDAPEDSTLTPFQFEITHPGIYQILVRSNSGSGFWVKSDADQFYGSNQEETFAVDTGTVALLGLGSDHWTWESYGEFGEADSLNLFAVFENSGVYKFHFAGMQQGSRIDRIALFQDVRALIALDTATNESPLSCEDDLSGIFWASGRTLEVTLTDQGMALDGLEDDEWQYSDTVHALQNPGYSEAPGSGDLSLIFRVAYDPVYFYFLGEVTDDHLSGSDRIGLFFNPDNQHEILGRYGEDARSFVVEYGSPEERFAWTETLDGYLIEARIPWSQIFPAGRTPLAGDVLGFEVQLDDADLEETIEHSVAWANDTPYDFSPLDTRKFGLIRLKPAEYKYVSKSGWEVIYADSEEAPGSKEKVIDGNPLSNWQTKWRGGHDPLPHELQIDFKEPLNVKDLHYLPNQNAFGPDGSIGAYEIFVSDNPGEWGEPVAQGELEWPEDLETNYKGLHVISLDQVTRGQYLRLAILSEAQNDPEVHMTSIAELDVVTGILSSEDSHWASGIKQIRIYPNPVVGDQLYVEFPRDLENGTVSLYTLQGKVVHEKISETGERVVFHIDSSLPRGMYLLRVSTEDTLFVEKIILQ